MALQQQLQASSAADPPPTCARGSVATHGALLIENAALKRQLSSAEWGRGIYRDRVSALEEEVAALKSANTELHCRGGVSVTKTTSGLLTGLLGYAARTISASRGPGSPIIGVTASNSLGFRTTPTRRRGKRRRWLISIANFVAATSNFAMSGMPCKTRCCRRSAAKPAARSRGLGREQPRNRCTLWRPPCLNRVPWRPRLGLGGLWRLGLGGLVLEALAWPMRNRAPWWRASSPWAPKCGLGGSCPAAQEALEARDESLGGC